MISDVENILNDDVFFADTSDIRKESVEQHKKRESLKGAITNRKRNCYVVKNNGHMKGLINLTTELLIKCLVNTSCMN